VLCCHHAQDGALNNEELNNFQYQCFGQPLTPDELASVRQMVAERMADGLNDAGRYCACPGCGGAWLVGMVGRVRDPIQTV
jgi:hypothetical protein